MDSNIRETENSATKHKKVYTVKKAFALWPILYFTIYEAVSQ